MQLTTETKKMLRDYQLETVDNVSNAQSKGINRQLVVLPTGAGKTVIGASIIAGILAEQPGRALFLAHRDELLHQTIKKLEGIMKLSSHPKTFGLVQGPTREFDRDIIVASVQTLKNHLDQLPNDVPIIITDEAHHAAAPTYQAIYKQYGLFGRIFENKSILHIGLTATPERADHKHLREIFDKIVQYIPVTELIEKGHLTPFRAEYDPIAVSMPQRGNGVDWTDEELARWVEKNEKPLLSQIAMILEKHAQDRKRILVFVPSVNFAERLTDFLVESGETAEFVIGDTPHGERQAIYQSVKDGHTRFLVNCMVLTEGFDLPELDTVLLVRPTQSASLYIQMVGRGLRTAEWIQKKDCLILDVVGNGLNHSVLANPTLGTDFSEMVTEEINEKLFPKPETVNHRGGTPDLEDKGDGKARKLKSDYAVPWISIGEGTFGFSGPGWDEFNHDILVLKQNNAWVAMEIVGDRVTEMYRGDDPDQAKFFAERTAKRIISPRFLAGRDRDRWAGDRPSDKTDQHFEK